jgi:hypothetical protein
MVASVALSSREAGVAISFDATFMIGLFPSAYQIEPTKLRQALEEAHLAWQIEWKARQQEFVIENIRFAHDPRWKYRFLSIQSARDANHWIWKATRVVGGVFGASI